MLSRLMTATIGLCLLAGCTGEIEIEPHRELSSADLRQEVTVLRDQFGVPHIFGETTEDMLFAVGYTMAEDRLFQFEITRRAGAGELADILGEDLVEVDIETRKVGYTRAQLDKMINDMPADQRTHLIAMVKGINHYVAEMRADPDKKLPLEFSELNVPIRTYTPQDVLTALIVPWRFFGAAGGHELVNQSFLNDLIAKHGETVGKQIFNDVLVASDPDAYAFTSPGTEVLVSVPQYDQAAQNSLTAPARLAAYNAKQARITEKLNKTVGLHAGASRTMVVGKTKSATGNVLMMQATADGMEMHLNGAGINVGGLTFAAAGLPIMGRAENFGWLITTAERDMIDTFREYLNPDNKYQYRHKGVWQTMERRTEIIQVADGDPVEIEVATTIHGPVIEWDEDNNLAYAQKHALWMTEAQNWGALFNLLTSQDITDLESKLERASATGMNLTYADVNGHIETRATGFLPIRSDKADPRLPTPGTGQYEWQGFIDHDDLPNLENPERDYLFIWNNKPSADTVSGDASRWGKHFRTHLPLALLEADDKISLKDLEDMNKIISAGWGSINLQLTAPDFFHSYWKDALQQTDDPELKEMINTLLDWNGLHEDKDGDGSYDHAGVLLFRTWLMTAMETVYQDDMDDWWYRFDEHLYIKYGTSLLLRTLEGDEAGLPTQYDFLNGKTRTEVMLTSLEQTHAKLRDDHSGDIASWKMPVIWRYMSDEALEDADDDMPPPAENAAWHAEGYVGAGVMLGYIDPAVVHNGAPNWMAIMEIKPDDKKLKSLVPTGGQSWFINSDWKASPHINDQMYRHRDFDFKTLNMEREAIEKVTEARLIMKPVK